MIRRTAVFVLLGVLAVTTACSNKKVVNPLANVGSKQPDKVLFDRAMDDMKHNRFDQARLALQTLINTYPDSEFIARAKLSVADSWYAEGGSTSLAQAEIEYNDFKTFFPNMAEAAEAQLKIANIHYQQMEKPDRDYTHAVRAEEEYRNLIQEFPDSKLVPTAKQRLMEVQEVLAQREFAVGRFYYLRESYPAAIARLESVANDYPLYSRADETLYLLGQSYEGEVAMIRSKPFNETQKAKLIADFTKHAVDAYSRIVTRYPLMDRADDAKLRLTALHQPVPRPTKAAVAQNKAEEDSRRETSVMTKVVRNFSKHPDVAQASRVGEPTLVDPQAVSASEVVQRATQAMNSGGPSAGKNGASVETIGRGAPPPGQEAPRSDDPAASTAAGVEVVQPAGATPAPEAGASPFAQPASADPNAPAAADELKPNVSDDGAQPLPPPQQVNEIQPAAVAGGVGSAPASGADQKTAASASSSSDPQMASDSEIASSKHKKKKGLKKVVPF